jgi:hypothetical protein
MAAPYTLGVALGCYVPAFQAGRITKEWRVVPYTLGGAQGCYVPAFQAGRITKEWRVAP